MTIISKQGGNDHDNVAGSHHSKTLKDGWAKYIPNFALK